MPGISGSNQQVNPVAVIMQSYKPVCWFTPCQVCLQDVWYMSTKPDCSVSCIPKLEECTLDNIISIYNSWYISMDSYTFFCVCFLFTKLVQVKLQYRVLVSHTL